MSGEEVKGESEAKRVRVVSVEERRREGSEGTAGQVRRDRWVEQAILPVSVCFCFNLSVSNLASRWATH